jgi:hypothetical protein
MLSTFASLSVNSTKNPGYFPRTHLINDPVIGLRCHSHMFLVGIQHTGSPAKALGDDDTIIEMSSRFFTSSIVGKILDCVQNDDVF